MANLKDTCAIVRVGETKYGVFPGVSDIAFIAEASKKAVKDAGLTKNEIDGLCCVPPYHEHQMIASGKRLAAKVGSTHLRFAV